MLISMHIYDSVLSFIHIKVSVHSPIKILKWTTTQKISVNLSRSQIFIEAKDD